MMKRAGQLFDVLLAILVINKIFTMACTPDPSDSKSSQPALSPPAEGAKDQGQDKMPKLEAIPLEKSKNGL